MLRTAETNLDTTIEDIAEYARMLTEGAATRVTQEEAYAAGVIKSDAALEALDEAVGLVASLQAGTTFL